MAKCAYCGISYSSKVLKIHQEQCPQKNNETIKEANEITLDKATKRDLIVYILSATDEYDEKDLSKMVKKDLFDISKEL